MMMSWVLCLLIAGVWSSDPENRTVKKRASGELMRVSTFHSGAHMLDQLNPQRIWNVVDSSVSVVRDPGGSSDQVLRVHYARGSYSSLKDRDYGAGFYSYAPSHHDAMMLSYDIFFDHTFEWVRGGKLPGLWGGITENCSGGRHSDNCFSTRFMWRREGDGEIYAYISKDHQLSGFCDRSNVVCNTEKGDSLGRGTWRFRTNQWQNIAQYVHLNRVGHADGYVKVYYNRHLVFEMHNLVIRTKSSVHIDGMYFTTFFGGGDEDWATPHDTYTYYRNFVMSLNDQPPDLIG